MLLERTTIKGLMVFLDFVNAYMDGDDAEQAKSLINSANIDLIAGCELARFGYLKQAYTLWRSWYEQVMFALYFLEAPIHRQAWKVSEIVTTSESPKYRLMLHQLLADSSEKHAFVLVYTDRYIKLLEVLKRGKPAKSRQLLEKAGKILTVLSQGVHGTYRPAFANNDDELSRQIFTHCLPTLEEAWVTVSEFWLLFLINIIDLPSDAVVSLGNGSLSMVDAALLFPKSIDPKDAISIGPDDAKILVSLNEFFLPAFK